MRIDQNETWIEHIVLVTGYNSKVFPPNDFRLILLLVI
ncbi:unnamed protein product [Haemonchus placei]|uniref:Flavin-containing monooxygenase n=1 Tax=Haemonchus placei TaxID=6290 RepID=A0A0N4W112_HAEPC|nr:unnamed protein product [Haemonchus placei]